MKHIVCRYNFENLLSGLQSNVDLGLIHVNCHKNYPDLRLFTYSKLCTIERSWNDFTLIARGLVLDIKNNLIVALPFPKFFNLNENESVWIHDSEFEVYPKMDGSLGIAFYYANAWHVATKGSFHSEQAEWATNYLRSNLPPNLNPDITYLFEIIYPSNRIVIDYQGESKLCLLGGFNNKTGKEYSPGELCCDGSFTCVGGYDIINPIKFNSLEDILTYASNKTSLDEEGYVIKFLQSDKSYNRLKVKFEPYCRAHRLISNITPLALWELLSNDPDQINLTNSVKFKEEIPEELHKDYDKIVNLLLKQRSDILSLVLSIDREYLNNSNTPLYKFIKSYDQKLWGLLFAYFKGKEYDHIIWDMIRPKDNILEGYKDSSVINRFSTEPE